MAHPLVADGRDGLQFCKVAANILVKQSKREFGVGHGANKS
jgi:hypothetical protein